jgi:hypothetical protein
MLLALCDGSRTCAEVVRSLQTTTRVDDANDFEQKVLDALEALRARNVLTYRDPVAAKGGVP